MRILLFAVASIGLTALGASCAQATGWDSTAATRALSNDQPKQALSAAREHLANHPDDPEARFVKAMALADTNRLDEASTIFKTLAAQYPKRARVWNNLGVLYARQGRLDEARTALVKATAAAPDYGEARENLGDVYLALADAAYRRAGAESANHKRRRLKGLVSATNVASSKAAGDRVRTANSKEAATPGTKPKSGLQQISQQIDQVLTRWASARSRQDVSAVMSAYSDDYEPAGGTGLAEWIKRQRARITAPKTVAVSVSHIRVERQSARRAKASFIERYQTPDTKRQTKRQMRFVREDGDWRIAKAS